MNDALLGLGGAVVGAIATIIASRSTRPTRTRTLVDAGGLVIQNLREEIARLDEDLDEARAEADGARIEARACRDAEQKLQWRVTRLEDFLRQNGIDPKTINGTS